MDYQVEIIYKRIKNMHLRVKQGKVVITAPYFTFKSDIERFLKASEEYIQKHLIKEQELIEKRNLEYGNKVVILDNEYEILPISTKSKITEHYLFINQNKDIRKEIKSLFKEKLYEKLYLLTLFYYNKMYEENNMPRVIIKDVKSRWGCYNRKNHTIEYASELIFKDKSVYDYLVVHELAHIKEFNHQAKFYNIVSKYCPNYKALRKLLKEK